jgi:hypothetical protein
MLAVAGAVVVIVVPIVLLVILSSGDKSNSEAADTWAGGLCTSVATYVDSLTAVGSTLQGGSLTRETLKSAADDAADATRTFASDVEELGAPDVSGGTKAKQQVDALATQLRSDADQIRSATDGVSQLSELASALPAIGATLSKAQTQITHTLDELRTLDPKGELQKAFASADSCSSLTGS